MIGCLQDILLKVRNHLSDNSSLRIFIKIAQGVRKLNENFLVAVESLFLTVQRLTISFCLQMKAKSRLQGFSSIEDEIDADNNIEVPKHKPMTYEGICDTGNDENADENYCLSRPNKCLHGIYD